MNADEPVDALTPSVEPQPLPVSPLLQVASWLAGIVGGVVFMSVLTVSTTRCVGSTKAYKLRWQDRARPVPQSSELADAFPTGAETSLASSTAESSNVQPPLTTDEMAPWHEDRNNNITTDSRR